MRGKHHTTCKAGRRKIELIKKVPGIKAVLIGRSLGGKGLHQASDGTVKLQTSRPGAITAVMQTSKGVQNITFLLEPDALDSQVRNLLISKKLCVDEGNRL